MENKKTALKDIFLSRAFHRILIGVGALLVLLLTFQAGIFVGYHKAAFSFRGGDNYYRTFDEKKDVRGGFPMMGDFPNAHGASGRIVSIQLPNIVIEDRDKVEKVVATNDRTVIRKFRGEAAMTDLAVGDIVVVIGNPNQNGQIDAEVIRLLPPPPTNAQGPLPSTSTGTPR